LVFKVLDSLLELLVHQKHLVKLVFILVTLFFREPQFKLRIFKLLSGLLKVRSRFEEMVANFRATDFIYEFIERR
jgi:hypothetical protein